MSKKLFGTADHCAFPGCTMPVAERTPTGELVVHVQVAHIRAVAPGGPRWDTHYADVDDPENLLLLCTPHHRTVDRPSTVKTFDVPTLERWRDDQRRQKDIPWSAAAFAEIELLLIEQEQRERLARLRPVLTDADQQADRCFHVDNSERLEELLGLVEAEARSCLAVVPERLGRLVAERANLTIGLITAVKNNYGPRPRAWRKLADLADRPSTRPLALPALEAVNALNRLSGNGMHPDYQRVQEKAREALYVCRDASEELSGDKLTRDEVETLINDASQGSHAAEEQSRYVLRDFRSRIHALDTEIQHGS